MKIKLIYILLGVLIITNSVMLFMLINKPHRRHGSKSENFLAKKLNLNSDQKESFLIIDKAHRSKMEFYDAEIRELKKNMFNALTGVGEVDTSITQKIGELLIKKENDLFYFFKNIRNICDQEQLKLLEAVIKKAVMHSGNGPDNMRPPPPDFGRGLPPPLLSE